MFSVCHGKEDFYISRKIKFSCRELLSLYKKKKRIESPLVFAVLACERFRNLIFPKPFLFYP